MREVCFMLTSGDEILTLTFSHEVCSRWRALAGKIWHLRRNISFQDLCTRFGGEISREFFRALFCISWRPWRFSGAGAFEEVWTKFTISQFSGLFPYTDGRLSLFYWFAFMLDNFALMSSQITARYCPRLTHLSASSARFTDKGLQKMAKACQHLEAGIASDLSQFLIASISRIYHWNCALVLGRTGEHGISMLSFVSCNFLSLWWLFKECDRLKAISLDGNKRLTGKVCWLFSCDQYQVLILRQTQNHFPSANLGFSVFTSWEEELSR